MLEISCIYFLIFKRGEGCGASELLTRACRLSQTGTTWRRRASPPERPSSSRSPGRPLSPGPPRRLRQAVAADDIPVFDRNKVSLDLPGSLFGPSVSLLIRTTKIIGDVIQNSAVRYQTFLRLFRPLFRGPFEIKGLDPPTTTTTTTTTTTAAPDADNEVRRR
ncbi:hypothetical protein PYW07_008786 [Mythimna separata]|uniref:Uncharacterized protein n=1 Tax=Mythimna separata TaxID=271217 RepID=A0AAD7YAY6_MYTSE|nr:hypothetical protein PYW07_008786 [Mythimna separata]